MKTQSTTRFSTTVAATVSGDDVLCGDFVAILTQTCELPSYLWNHGESLLPAHELVRLRVIPEEAGTPLKVFAVCLPFVYAKTVGGELKTLDVRRDRIVRLARLCAKRVWSEMKKRDKPGVL